MSYLPRNVVKSDGGDYWWVHHPKLIVQACKLICNVPLNNRLLIRQLTMQEVRQLKERFGNV